MVSAYFLAFKRETVRKGKIENLNYQIFVFPKIVFFYWKKDKPNYKHDFKQSVLWQL
jgi:hypothetical protein